MDNLMNLVSKLNKKMSHYILSELEKEGIHNFALSHGHILINFKNKTEMNYSELSKGINKSPQTVTTLVRKLEKDGCLSLRVDEKDKRNKLVRLSEKGKAFLPIMMRISSNMYEIQYDNISNLEQEQLKELLVKVLNNY